MTDLYSYLSARTYPGRGILVGQNSEGRYAHAYWIMGRSENSRNRIFVDEPDGIRTEAFDPSKLSDPSLIIYHPVRFTPQGLIITNGDQTDTVRDFLAEGKSYEDALRTRTFEPDGPNWTPRISAHVTEEGFELSILKSGDAEGTWTKRQFFEYPFVKGKGYLITTYQDNGSPLPSFAGEPVEVDLEENDIEAFAKNLFESLNEDNRISLWVYMTDSEEKPTDGEYVICNVHDGGEE